MDQSEVVKAVNAEIDRAESFMDSRIARERALAYDYYYGKEFGNEIEGRSRVVSADVAQCVDSAVPALVKIFVAGDKAVEFTPRMKEDVDAAEQATLGANYVFFTQNNGYALAHDFIKDGLLQKTGVFKWTWDTSQTVSEKRFTGLSDLEFQMLEKQLEASGGELAGHTQNGEYHDVVVRVKKGSGRVKVVVAPPEEVLISPDAMGLDVMEMPFIAHTPLLTSSDLVQMGVPPDVIARLPKGDDVEGDEKTSREERTDQMSEDGPDLYRYDECYLRLDEDGDGIAELRKVCKVGDYIIHDESVDHIPMAIWTPKVMPHEVVGVSLADDVMDLQLLKSTIWRQVLDNLYLTNAPRMFAQGNLNMDEVLSVKPGGVIQGDMNSALTPITVPFMAQHGYSMLEYIDQEEEVRTGISRLFQGIDPQSINKTATGVNALINQANARVELMARNAAEFGFKPLFKGILYLLSKHQQQPLMARLSNKFVPIDPETWNKEYDMTCNVGLGTGTKEQQLMQLQMLGGMVQAIAQSPFAPVLLDAKKIYNMFEKTANLSGFKDASVFLNDPMTTDPQTGEQKVAQPPPQKPESVQVAEIKAQTDAQKAQSDAQIKQQEVTSDAQLKHYEVQEQMALEAFKIQQQKDLEIFKAQLNARVQIQTAAMQPQEPAVQ